MEITYRDGLWWFDQNNGKRYGYNIADQTISEEWFDGDERHHHRVWRLGEFKYSHSDATMLNRLFRYLTPFVGVINVD